MGRHVGQALALERRVGEHHRVGIGVGGDQAPVRGDLAGHVQLEALRADLAGGAVEADPVDHLRVEHVLLDDVVDRGRGGDAREQLRLQPDLVGVAVFRRQGADGAGDRGVRPEGLAVGAVDREAGRQQVDDAGPGHELAPRHVGVEPERPASSRGLGVVLVAQAPGDDEPVGQVDRVLGVDGGRHRALGLVAVGGHHVEALGQGPVDGVEDVEAGVVGAADQAGAQHVGVVVGGAHQEVVVEAEEAHLADRVEPAGMHLEVRILRRVGAPGQHAGAGVVGDRPRLVVLVEIVAVGVVEVHLPGVAQDAFDLDAGDVALARGDVVAFVEAAVAGHGHRLAGGRIEHRAAVEGRLVVRVLVVQPHHRLVALPGQRGGEHLLVLGAEVAPVFLVAVLGDEAVGEVGARDRPGLVHLDPAAVEARAPGLEVAGLDEARLLGDDVDEPARIEDAVERRGRALEHLDPLRGRHEGPRQRRAQSVAQDRAVAVVAEAPADEGVLGAAQRVGLGDARDVDERLVQRPHGLVLQHLLGDDGDRLRHLDQRRVGARGDRGAQGLVAARVRLAARDRQFVEGDHRIAGILRLRAGEQELHGGDRAGGGELPRHGTGPRTAGTDATRADLEVSRLVSEPFRGSSPQERRSRRTVGIFRLEISLYHRSRKRNTRTQYLEFQA
ncbi:hypothetical protein MPOCJGCO_2805 [Methylobacterium trifolii]|uniref:Uncharacterized protein n=1 Tax=Methylobacterium trifolii TaxID=1003092 RepID=A0ABQ4TZS0_9HYPH|nr:hypothetical protein MPOCJGCO_2805 [Methylobacterium trifolii]